LKKTLYIFIFISSTLFSQTNVSDSVKTIIERKSPDSTKAIRLNQMAWDLINLGEFKSAFICLDESEKLSKENNLKLQLAKTTGYKGIAYRMQGEFKEAINYLSAALRMTEQLNHRNGQATCLSNLGIIYEQQQNYKKAFEYYNKALEIRTAIGDKQSMIFSYNDIAILFDVQNDFKNSITYFIKGLELGEEIGDSAQIALCNRSLGNCYLHSNDPVKAKGYSLKALDYFLSVGDKDGQCRTFCSLGEIEILNKNYKAAIEYFEKSLKIAEKSNVKEIISQASMGMASSYYNLGDYKKAYDYQMIYITVKDSILNTETSQLMAEINTKYETEKKDKLIALQKADAEKEQLVKKGFIYGFIALAILMIFIFRGYLQKRKDNKIIAEQKATVEEKQKEILDSIKYAKRIQSALMQNEKYIGNNLNRLNKD
jgi:tetratricopeptide (TPR) repeat protein